ncbi:MAG: EAL domain-containing protein, partial [Solirubrobacterales bacterium]
DISLTRGIDTDQARRALAKGLITFAHEIGAEIVAEGVETESELDCLRELGVSYGQGYILGRPMHLGDVQKIYSHV